MANPISALKHRSFDFIREVSLDALTFYADGLSGIYLPEDFKQEHGETYGVKYWTADERLNGKFGRITLKYAQEEEPAAELDDILLMGTTIGVHSLDRYNQLESLRHYSFREKLRDVVEARGLLGMKISYAEVDYGDTRIMLGESGAPERLEVSGNSFDFGRANTEGRQQTCDLFQRILGSTIEIVNSYPEPNKNERIIGRR